MDTIDLELQTKVDAHSEALVNKAKHWMLYLENLTKNLNNDDGFYPHKDASLWASTFSFIEWLIVFSNYKTRLEGTDVAVALNRFWGWDENIGKIFWAAGRNPIAHVGQANSFYSFRNFNEMPTNVSFNSGRWSKAVTDDWYKYNSYTAVSILPPLDTEEGNIQIITFFHQMLLSDLLPRLVESVALQIKNERNPNNIAKLIKLNKQILY